MLTFASSTDSNFNVELLRKHPRRLVVTGIGRALPRRVTDDPASNMLHNVRGEPASHPHFLKVTLAEVLVVDHATTSPPRHLSGRTSTVHARSAVSFTSCWSSNRHAAS